MKVTGELNVDLDDWQPVRHPQIGFTLSLPAHLGVRTDVSGVALVASEAPRPGYLAANIVVTVEDLGDEPYDDWVSRSGEAAAAAFDQSVLVDEEDLEVTRGRMHRWLWAYRHTDVGGVMLEQFAQLHDGLGYVVSCTAGALEYDALAESFGFAATSLQPGEPR